MTKKQKPSQHGGSLSPPCFLSFTRGDKRYEITNHLGKGFTYAAATIRTTDYYPFGLEMNKPATEFGDFKGYRFGFNGKEADTNNEWGGGTHYDYGFRIYNPSIARFLSVDPLSPDYPSWTPYAFAMNR